MTETNELRRRRHDRILTSDNDKRSFVYRQIHKYIASLLNAFPHPTLHLLFNCVLTILNKRMLCISELNSNRTGTHAEAK